MRVICASQCFSIRGRSQSRQQVLIFDIDILFFLFLMFLDTFFSCHARFAMIANSLLIQSYYSFGSFSLLFTAFEYCSNLIQLKPYQTAPWWRRLSGPSSPCLRLSLLCPPSPARLHLPRFPRCCRVRKRVVNVFYSESFVFLDCIHFSMKPGTHQPYDGYVASTRDSLYHSLSSA